MIFHDLSSLRIDRAYVREVLDGKIYFLINSFDWNSSGFPPYHWESIYRRERKLSDFDKLYLKFLYYHPEENAKCYLSPQAAKLLGMDTHA